MYGLKSIRLAMSYSHYDQTDFQRLASLNYIRFSYYIIHYTLHVITSKAHFTFLNAPH